MPLKSQSAKMSVQRKKAKGLGELRVRKNLYFLAQLKCEIFLKYIIRIVLVSHGSLMLIYGSKLQAISLTSFKSPIACLGLGKRIKETLERNHSRICKKYTKMANINAL